MRSNMRRTTVWLDYADGDAIQTIKTRYGCESDSQAVRLALRVLAASPMLEIQLPPRPPHARRSPKEISATDNSERVEN